MIFYCLFNYHLQEGMNSSGQVVIDRKTGVARPATKKDIEAREGMQKKMVEQQKAASAPGGAMDKAEKKQKIQQAAEKELSRDREIALSEKTPTQKKEAIESSALSRMVESIDGKSGQETERKAAAQMASIVDSPEGETGERGEALGTGGGMAEEARAAAANLSTIAMKDTMKKVAEAQNAAVENLTSSISQSKNLDKKLSGVAKNYGLASQGEGVDGVVGAGSEVSGSTKNSNELIKQRDRIAARFGCEERCKYLYDDQTGFLCDSGNCICKINRDKKELLKLPGEAKDDEAKKKKSDQEIEAFTGTSKYVYRIHGKCDTTEIDRGEA